MAFLQLVIAYLLTITSLAQETIKTEEAPVSTDASVYETLYAQCYTAGNAVNMAAFMAHDLERLKAAQNVIVDVLKDEIPEAAADVTTFYKIHPEKGGTLLWEIDLIADDLTATHAVIAARVKKISTAAQELNQLYGANRIPKRRRADAAHFCARDRLLTMRLLDDATSIITAKRNQLNSYHKEWLP